MEQNSDQEQKKTLFEQFPFLLYLKGRLISYVDKETGRHYTGHVAMYYHDTQRIRIDWCNGLTDYYKMGKDAVWLFNNIKKKTMKHELSFRIWKR